MDQSVASWRKYCNERILICVFLGFTSGLPLFILLNLLQAWLSTSGLNVKTLGLFSLVMIPYTWKFLWSPLMDRCHIPWLGRRRGWIAITQILLFLSIGVMGALDPQTQLGAVVFFAVAVAFISASQDIVVDAYRREILLDHEQGLGSAVHVNAYKVAAMVPGALSLILADHFPWAVVFWMTAAFMVPGLLCTFIMKEPALYGEPPKNLRAAIVEPFREFILRGGWQNALWILSFILLYKLGDSMATALITKFYLDTGFTLTQIGAVAKTTGLWASIVGGFVGGVWMIRLGINRSLWVFGVVQALATLGFVWLAQVGPDVVVLALAIAFEAFGVGLGTTALVAYIAKTTNPLYTATQFALFTSLSAVPRTFMNALTGYIVEATGWTIFFVICFVLAVPGMLMLMKVAPWKELKES